MINKSNYEAFALDYLEGTLSAMEQREMELFLQKHPLIAAELAEMQNLIILEADESIVFDNKMALLKSEGGAKIVAMHRRTWFRVAVSAAAILFLVGGYFAGYFTGKTEGIEPEYVQIEKEQKVEEETKETTFEKDKAVAIEEEKELQKTEETPVLEEKKVQKAIPATQPKSIQNLENVAENTPKKVSKSQPNTTIEKVEIENIQKKEEAVTVEEKIEENLTPEQLPEVTPEMEMPELPLEEEAVANNNLPAEKVENSVAETPQIQEEVTTIIETAVADNSAEMTEKEDGKKKGKKRKVLRKIGRFLGDLPFEEVTASFVPTYLRDSK